MVKVYVKGDWLTNLVQPNILVRFIHTNSLGIIADFTEDKEYNVLLHIAKCHDSCLETLRKEFPQYEFLSV